MTKIRHTLRDFKAASYVRNPIEKLKEYGIDINTVIDCSLGTNPYGCTPRIKQRVMDINWGEISHYPDTSYPELKKSIVDYWKDVYKLEESDIFLGSGAAGILANLNKMFVQEGSRVLGYSPQFSENINFAKILGGKYEFVPLESKSNFSFDVEGFIGYIKNSHDVIYIDNPNNPTGQIIRLSDIQKIVKKAAELHIPIIIDEAYGDFMDKSNSAISLCEDFDNLIIVRSFSKGLGLANLRLGYVIIKGPIKEYYNTVNIPPFVFADTLSGLAIESLEDESFIINSRQQIKKAKEKLITACKGKFNIAQTSLEVPIFLISHADPKKDLYDTFLKSGIITAPGEEFPGIGKNYARIRIPAEISEMIKRLVKL